MDNSNKTFLIYGVSKGLGKAIVQAVPQPTDTIYGVSRSQPQETPNLNWICADLSKPEQAVNDVKTAIGQQKLDVLIYNVGIWEQQAFSDNYNFENVPATEINQIINTNITTCILSIQSLIENLKLSKNAKIILIGSTWGVDNHNGKELVFSATKFALRGIAQSLREILREHLIGVSVLNLGYLASEYEIDKPTQDVLEETKFSLIPLSDVIQAIHFIISTTKASCVKEILMPAMLDQNV
ncbi:SDR family oxidoreductase [Acinetobacter higginsii]|uniref:SDR family oxidoreductase n=1 Tax=Acinetobacter higginsii TaxID=70347 RepID=UPI001F4AD3BC|nr:SDR family oxidoreductase [Acinetobacter higginsii]MCH7295225.1 SDR family oxidoreductase [Acinetobacter higginsii]MCH7317110.1 SDR family oxidoreductase [Acinetobacter higginsii]MDO3664083.1 SDR family oxidoreductase [Acinetobacter higginsii]